MNGLEKALQLLREKADGERAGVIRDILEPFNTGCLHCLHGVALDAEKQELKKTLEYYGGFEEAVSLLE